jgi:hypothetical protein
MNTLLRMGMQNDDVSSIRFQGGAVARLFEHDHFQGKTLVLNTDTDCFVNLNWNDILSSIQVY